MRKISFTFIIVYTFFILSGSLFGLGEKTLTLGTASSWEAVEKWQGVTEAALIRPHPVLVLSDTNTGNYIFPNENVDLHLSFDEASPARFVDAMGRYDVSVSSGLDRAPSPWSRIGAGAARFMTNVIGAAPIVLKPRAVNPATPVTGSFGAAPLIQEAALFAPRSRARDFSIEFWLYPQSMENGEELLSFNSILSQGSDPGYILQRIHCNVIRNRLQWAFDDFFYSPDGKNSKSITLTGPQVLPGTWSHHLIRYDADLGMLEYLVNGRLEVLEYTTLSGREGGEVYTPLTGDDCSFTLGGLFSGIMDEFRIHRNYIQSPALTRYPSAGGRIETRALDLGHNNSRINRIDAYGGRTSGVSGKVTNEYAGKGNLNFQDHSQIRFFMRASNDPYRWNNIPWVPVNPGTDISGRFRGRYIQIAVEFYPSWDGETSPYLSELRVEYIAEEPPYPPTQVAAVSRDGAVELSWRSSPSRDTAGYLVYYGTSSGEYFGDSAILISTMAVTASPLDVGNRTSVRIEGLRNGTLYYFAVAAYSLLSPVAGEFSREVAARPLPGTGEDY